MRYKFANTGKIHSVEPPCRKKMYDSREEAEDMIKFIKESRVSRGIHAYKCNICGFWHLTSKAE